MIGTLVSHYRILRKVGQGGMGEVFLAEDTELQRNVALKFLPPRVAQDEEMLERFQREARATAALQHPNIVTIHEIGTHEGRRFIVMAYIEGELLAERIERGDLTIPDVVDIGLSLADALGEAHGGDIIHRDLKPDNIIIDKRGQPHVLDFGLAVWGKETRLTREGSTVGTLHYMSPEQVQGGEVDERTDIFSLGAILYEMITCHRAFPGDNSAEIVNRILHTEPQPMARYNNDVDEDLERIVATALAKDRSVRYQTMSGLAAALKPLQQSSSGTAVTRASHLARPAQTSRRRFPLWAVAVIAAVVVAGGWFALRPRGTGSPGDTADPKAASTQTLGQIRTLAVLPLRNSQGEEEQYFADGMTEAIINDLSHVSALTVFPSSSVLDFRGSDKSVQEIAAELGADAVITGSIWQDGGRVRINVDLVPAGATERLWGESYESDFDDLLALQSQLAREITGQVKVSVEPLEDAWFSQERSADPDALKAYLKGLYYRNLMTEEGTTKAEELFERSVALDPDFAPAYSALGSVRVYTVGWEDALEQINKALELDPNQVDALATLAAIQMRYLWDFDAAQKTIDRARALQPNNPSVHRVQGDLLLVAGKDKEGIGEYRRAVALSPLSHPIACALVARYVQVQDFDTAIEYGIEVNDGFPTCSFEFVNVAEAYMYKQDYAKAMEFLEKSDKIYPGSSIVSRACVYALSGEREKAEEILQEVVADGGSPFAVAMIQTALGDEDQAIDSLEQAYEMRSSSILWITHEPIFEKLQDNPRFVALVEKVKLPTG